MKATMIQDSVAYYNLLRYDKSGRHLQTFIEALTVNETYFFREFEQLRCFAEEVLPIVGAKKKQGLKIWSAGCSTGEEAYTLAIILLEMLDGEIRSKSTILATDINQQVLEIAEKGIYDERAIRKVPLPYRSKYFTSLSQGYQVIPRLKRMIDFRQTNILDSTIMPFAETIDVIFCRNVLIYFDDNSRHKAVLNFFKALRSGGFIFLGHAESMSRITDIFQLQKFKDIIIYQKPM
ncbi:protein-glutamate O-methyltransferase CheR [Heliorestis convoluta]|uniref:Protein-glutamate O-methyltransferase CheR n=2 Tax=Heliorestis convoluta TaxID=356322 RepID=A0A5Q2MZT2_9FIRM|nr:protein-glutamate O-methyltransferase CheR [Heliorestis convoluta]